MRIAFHALRAGSRFGRLFTAVALSLALLTVPACHGSGTPRPKPSTLSPARRGIHTYHLRLGVRVSRAAVRDPITSSKRRTLTFFEGFPVTLRKPEPDC